MRVRKGEKLLRSEGRNARNSLVSIEVRGGRRGGGVPGAGADFFTASVETTVALPCSLWRDHSGTNIHTAHMDDSMPEQGIPWWNCNLQGGSNLEQVHLKGLQPVESLAGAGKCMRRKEQRRAAVMDWPPFLTPPALLKMGMGRDLDLRSEV